MLRAAIFKIIDYTYFAPGVVFLLSLLAYANSFPGAFHLDDVQMVQDNPLVATLDLHALFTSDYWGAESNTGLYRPITVLSFALNRLLLGAAPAGFHLVNLLLHAVISLLFFFTLQKWRVTRQVAWLAAALFAIHPLHTEVVNVVVGRSELLVAFFLLLALFFARIPVRWANAALLCSFALALLSKEHAIVFLAILPIFDWSVAEEKGWWRQRWPIYTALAVTVVIWLLLRSFGITLMTTPHPLDPFFTPLAFLPPMDRCVSALYLQLIYLSKLLLPWHLQGIYSDADVSTVVVRLASLQGLFVILCAGCAFAFLVRGLFSRSFLAICCLLYIVSFAPTSNFFFAAGVTFAERLTYLPSLWFCVAIAVILINAGGSRILSRFWSGVLPTLYLAILLILTLVRNPDFASSIRLWEANVAVAPRNVLAWMYLGSSYAEVERPVQADAAFQRMLALAPDFPDGLRNYAVFLVDSGRPAEAIPIAQRGTAAQQGKSPLSFLILAEAYYRVGEYVLALDALRAMEDFYLHYWYFWALKGMILEAQGKDHDAIAAFRRAQPWPSGSDLPMRTGKLLLKIGQTAEAENFLRDAAVHGGGGEVWNSLGVALALQNRKEEAIEAFRKAVEFNPQNSQYRANLQKISAVEQ